MICMNEFEKEVNEQGSNTETEFMAWSREKIISHM